MFPDLGYQYNFLKKIGSGGAGVVNLALDRYSGFLVAVKTLFQHHIEDEEVLNKFLTALREEKKQQHVPVWDQWDRSNSSSNSNNTRLFGSSSGSSNEWDAFGLKRPTALPKAPAPPVTTIFFFVNNIRGSRFVSEHIVSAD